MIPTPNQELISKKNKTSDIIGIREVIELKARTFSPINWMSSRKMTSQHWWWFALTSPYLPGVLLLCARFRSWQRSSWASCGWGAGSALRIA